MAHEFKDIDPNAPTGAKVVNWFENRFPTAFSAYEGSHVGVLRSEKL